MSEYTITYGVNSPGTQDPFNITLRQYKQVKDPDEPLEESDLDYETQRAFQKIERNGLDSIISVIGDGWNGHRDQLEEKLETMAHDLGFDPEPDERTYPSGDPFLVVSGGRETLDEEERTEALSEMGFSI
jgi:hypothetical protein